MLLLAVFVHAAFAQTPSARHDDEKLLPRCVVFVEEGWSMDRVLNNDSLFYSISQGVTFPVGKYMLDQEDTFLVELREVVLPEIKHQGWELAGIGLRGAASPEGSYARNQFLSQRRTESIIDFITSQMGTENSRLMGSSTVAEDYDYLLLLMEESDDPQTGYVRSIVDRHKGSPQPLKRELQTVQGGRLWKYLLDTYFPRLRTARMVLFFRPMLHLALERMARDVAMPQPVATVLPTMPETMEPLPALTPYKVPEREEPTERRHALSVGTNLLYDAFYLPRYGWAPTVNLELEYYPRRGRWTWLAAFTFPYYHRWNSHKFYQIRDYHLELRRYFKATDWHTGWFAAAYVNANKYGIGLSRTEGWQGEGAGGALKAGYVCRLGRVGRWRLEFTASVGGYVTLFDPYVYGNPVTGTEDGDYYYDYLGTAADFHRRNHRRVWIGPTELGIKLRCDLLFWRTQKKGVSLRRKEAKR